MTTKWVAHSRIFSLCISGGQPSATKCQQGPALRLWAEFPPASLAAGGSLPSLVSLACGCIAPVSASALTWRSPWVSISKCHSYKDTRSVGLGPTQVTLSSTDYICKDPTSKEDHIHRCWGLGLQHVFLGDTLLPVTYI